MPNFSNYSTQDVTTSAFDQLMLESSRSSNLAQIPPHTYQGVLPTFGMFCSAMNMFASEKQPQNIRNLNAETRECILWVERTCITKLAHIMRIAHFREQAAWKTKSRIPFR